MNTVTTITWLCVGNPLPMVGGSDGADEPASVKSISRLFAREGDFFLILLGPYP